MGWLFRLAHTLVRLNPDLVLLLAAYRRLYKLSHCRSLAGFDGKIRYNHPLK